VHRDPLARMVSMASMVKLDPQAHVVPLAPQALQESAGHKGLREPLERQVHLALLALRHKLVRQARPVRQGPLALRVHLEEQARQASMARMALLVKLDPQLPRLPHLPQLQLQPARPPANCLPRNPLGHPVLSRA